MEFKFVDIVPKDDKGYLTIKDYVVRIVAYLSHTMNYNDYFSGDELLIICTHIFHELFSNKNGLSLNYKFWEYNQYELLLVATNSLYIDYTNDKVYGGKFFPDYVRNSDKQLIDKIDNYLKANDKYTLEPHDYNHIDEFHNHLTQYMIDNSDDIEQLIKEYDEYKLRKNSP